MFYSLAKLAAAAAFGSACVFGFAQSKTWTTTADFNEGTYFNTNSTAVPNQLQLNPPGSAPTPFLNIPAAGDLLGFSPGRLVRIDTRTNTVIGVYRTVPNAQTSSPSRCTVDSQGNAWITNNYFSGTVAITKIGVIIGGERGDKVNGVFVPNPDGEYVRNWTFTTGVDRDGDGFIRTSRGLGNILNWNGTSGKDLDSSIPDAADGIVEEADDELILIFKRHRGAAGATRAVTIDRNDDVYSGFEDNIDGALKIDGDTGVVLQTITGVAYYYFLLWDNDRLWSSFAGSFTNLLTNTSKFLSANGGTPITFAPFGDGRVVSPLWSGGGFAIFDADGNKLAEYPTPGNDQRGVAVGLDGHIWIGSRGNSQVFRYRQDGTHVKTFSTGNRSTGVGIDADGFVWVTHAGENYATKIDPAGDSGKGAIVATVNIDVPSYNYSDGTGATTVTSGRSGQWFARFDGGVPGADWASVDWTASVPADTGLNVFLRAANTIADLSLQPWTAVTDGQNIQPLAIEGQYIEARVDLERLSTTVSATPILNDLTVAAPAQSRIDIEPGKFPNRIFLSKKYTVYVRLYGSPTLDVTKVNLASVKFGRTGTEASPVRSGIFRDFNGDGQMDALFGFRTQSCGFTVGNTEGFLSFEVGGKTIKASDSVLINP
jgi:streptogramin lyase